MFVLRKKQLRAILDDKRALDNPESAARFFAAAREWNNIDYKQKVFWLWFVLALLFFGSLVGLAFLEVPVQKVQTEPSSSVSMELPL